MQPVHEREKLKTYYQDEKLAQEYVAKRFRDPRGAVIHREQVDVVNGIIAEHRIANALELAPGPARATREVHGLTRGVAVDASQQMLDIARAVVDPAVWDLRQGDIYDLDLGETFPLLFTFRFIRHLKRDQRARVYEVVRRHLDTGGWFVFDAPNVTVELPLRTAHPEKFPVFDELWQQDELRKELAAEGFTVERLCGSMKWHGIQRVVSKVFSYGLTGVGTAIVGALDRLPGDEPLEWTVVCRR